MLNRLLLQFYTSPNNGKQVASLPDRRRVLLLHSEIMGPATIDVKVSRDPQPTRLANFQDVARVVGPDSQVPQSGPWGLGGSIVVIGDTLHLAWTGPHGISYTQAVINGDRWSWNHPRIILDGDYRLGDLFQIGESLALTYHQVHDRQTESIGVYWPDGSRPQQEIQRGAPTFAPVVEVDNRDRLHLVWSDTAEQVYYALLAQPGHAPQVELLGPGRQAAIGSAADRILIVCESDYGHLHYYFTDGDQWKRNLPLTGMSPWLTSDQLHSPQLSRDRHGVTWLFFADNTRRSTFWARWMGKEWGEITNGPRVHYRPPHFDFNLLPLGRICVEKNPPPNARDFGMLVTCEPPIRQVEYRRERVPDLIPSSSRKVLFLDMLEVAATENVGLHVETADKHPENPLMQLGPAGAFDEDRVFNHGSVVFDGGKYRMWYGGIREPRPDEPALPWWDWIYCGYAESEDGIAWTRVNVGLVEWNGSRDNNIIPGPRHAPVVFKDDGDPDPARRYKAFYFWNSGEHLEMARTGKYGRSYDPRDEKFLMDLFTSPDGIHLTRHAGEVAFPGEQARPLSTIPQSVFRDEDEPDPQKRYKAYGFASLNLRRRGTTHLYSPDCLHWTVHPEMPLIDPAVRGTPPAVGGPAGQVHDTVCFPYEGYYIALYQDQRHPRSMPVELAVSRDSESFRHVRPGSKVIPVGPPAAWDALTILPTMPVIRDREIRIYYGGGTERSVTDSDQPRWVARPGLATLRRDGFTSIRLAEDQQMGSVETIPFDLSRHPLTLHVNVRCAGGSSLRAELLDAVSDAPLPGYSLEQCQPVTGDQLDAIIRWQTKSTLPTDSTQVRLRFELRRNLNSPRLHALWFRPV